jgi:hypothetical protein
VTGQSFIVRRFPVRYEQRGRDHLPSERMVKALDGSNYHGVKIRLEKNK